jgi:hypothetical protein
MLRHENAVLRRYLPKPAWAGVLNGPDPVATRPAAEAARAPGV